MYMTHLARKFNLLRLKFMSDTLRDPLSQIIATVENTLCTVSTDIKIIINHNTNNKCHGNSTVNIFHFYNSLLYSFHSPDYTDRTTMTVNTIHLDALIHVALCEGIIIFNNQTNGMLY